MWRFGFVLLYGCENRMLSLLLFLCCAVYDPNQVELDRIVQMHRKMGHPALSVHGIMMDEHGKMSNQDFVLIWHPPAKVIIAGDVVTRSGSRVFILSMPESVEAPNAAKDGVRVK